MLKTFVVHACTIFNICNLACELLRQTFLKHLMYAQNFHFCACTKFDHLIQLSLKALQTLSFKTIGLFELAQNFCVFTCKKLDKKYTVRNDWVLTKTRLFSKLSILKMP